MITVFTGAPASSLIYTLFYFRLSARIAAEVSLWLCDLFQFSEGAAYCHDDTREGKFICSNFKCFS
jgi:hypothetical protein